MTGYSAYKPVLFLIKRAAQPFSDADGLEVFSAGAQQAISQILLLRTVTEVIIVLWFACAVHDDYDANTACALCYACCILHIMYILSVCGLADFDRLSL